MLAASSTDSHPGSETSSLAGGCCDDGTTGGGKDLFDFLREAQLEQYFLAFTTRLKVACVSQIKYVEVEDMADIGMSRPEMRRLRKFFERECPQTAMGKLKKLLDHQQFIPSHLIDKLSRSTSARSASATRAAGGDLSLVGRSLDMHGGGPGGLSSGTSPLQNLGGEGGQGGLVNSTTRHLILPEELELGNILGEGEFGRVHQGVWSPGGTGGRVQVAVKVLDKEKLCQEVTDFLKEVALMHSLDHPDIVRLFGVVMEQDALKMVTELAPLRSLLECLKEPAVRNSFPLPVLHTFAQQVAHGMEYLEGKRLIHRDLAARNILVFSKDKVKISDFGLSRALQLGKEYYQTNFNVNLKLPIAWCAPECINYLKFTSASDVWAYGVTLWEMFSYGFQPWVGLTGQQILERIDEPHLERLSQPDVCPVQHYELMLDCWKHEPKDRPNFIQITNRMPRMTPDRVQAVVDSSMMPPIGAGGSRPQANNGSGNFTPGDGSDTDSSQASTPVNGDENKSFSTSAAASGGSLPSLNFKSGEIIVILEKKSNSAWRGCTLAGRTGYFAPNLVRPYTPPISASGAGTSASLMRSPATLDSRNKFRLSRRASLSDLGHRRRGAADIGRMLGRQLSIRKRAIAEHNFSWLLSKASGYLTPEASRKQTVRGRLRADMIGLPQNDFRHIGHVGFDGSIFGDVNFIKNGEQEKLPVNPVLPYKPSNDHLPGTSSSISSHHPYISGSGRSHAARRGSPSGSCLTMTTVSDLNSRLSTGTLTDVSSCMNEQLDDGEESPPYETLDQQCSSQSSASLAQSMTQSLLSHRSQLHQPPPPLPPSRQLSTTSNTDDLFSDFKISSQSDISSSFDFGGSSLMDDIFKCLKIEEDDQASISSSNTLGGSSSTNQNSRAQSLRLSECTITGGDRSPSPPPPPAPAPPSITTQHQRSPSKRQEAIVKPLVISTSSVKKKEGSSPDSSDCSSSHKNTSSKKKSFQHTFKLGGGGNEQSNKQKTLPIYAKPIKGPVIGGGGNTAGGGTLPATSSTATAIKKQQPVISKPILISGPLPSTGHPLISAASICPVTSSVGIALSVDTTSSGSTPSISPAVSTTSVTSSGTYNPSTTAPAGGVGALRALRRGEGVFRVAGSVSGRRPSVGEGVTSSLGGGGTLTRSRQPSLPIVSKSTRFALGDISAPITSNLQPINSGRQGSIGTVGNSTQRRSSSVSTSSSEASSGGSLLSTEDASPAKTSKDQPSSFFESERSPTSPFQQQKNNGSFKLSEEASSFWGSDLAGLLGTTSTSLGNGDDHAKKQSTAPPPIDRVQLPASLKIDDKVTRAPLAIDTDDDDIVRM